jgi:hypothetical protein
VSATLLSTTAILQGDRAHVSKKLPQCSVDSLGGELMSAPYTEYGLVSRQITTQKGGSRLCTILL